MDADSSEASHRDSHGSRTRRDRHSVRDSGRERDRVREQEAVPYFADPLRERDRVKNLRQKSPRPTGVKRGRRTRSRSNSSERRRHHRRRSRSRSGERRHRTRSPRRRTPPPRIITVPVPVPAHEFAYGYGWPAPHHPAHQFNGMYGSMAYPPRPRFGYRPMRPSFQAPAYSRPYGHHPYRYRHPFDPQSRFSYRKSWQHPN